LHGDGAVDEPGDRRRVGWYRVTRISARVFGRVQVSTQALHELFDRHILILWFSYGVRLKGWPPRNRRNTSNCEVGRRSPAPTAGVLGLAGEIPRTGGAD
jgi:hypothetical protein